MTSLLISYLAQPVHGPSSGLRVWSDGRVELNNDRANWKPVTKLGPQQVGQLQTFVRESQILGMPATVPAPPGMQDSTTCEWQAELDDRQVQVLVHGWSDENPPARPLRNLVMQMYGLIAAAQRGEVS